MNIFIKRGRRLQADYLCRARKMENEIQAAATGVVVAVHVVKGDTVTPDESLLEIQPE